MPDKYYAVIQIEGDNMIGIYKITNTVNGKSYIGQSVDIEKRVRDHFLPSRSGHNKEFERDIEKYGTEAFKITVLEECERKDLLKLEGEYIQKEQPEYNSIIPGGHRNDDFRRKVSEGTKNWWKKLDPKIAEKIIRENLTGPKVGHKVSQHTRELLRQANLGKKQSAETIAKRSKALKARYAEHPKSGKSHFKPVRVIETGECFESVKAAAAHFGVKGGTVSAAIKRKGTVRGQHVEYLCGVETMGDECSPVGQKTSC